MKKIKNRVEYNRMNELNEYTFGECMCVMVILNSP